MVGRQTQSLTITDLFPGIEEFRKNFLLLTPEQRTQQWKDANEDYRQFRDFETEDYLEKLRIHLFNLKQKYPEFNSSKTPSMDESLKLWKEKEDWFREIKTLKKSLWERYRKKSQKENTPDSKGLM